ncbi:unnamed protein product [Nesidiocoris tenuis]|uniref:Uncharacterized protein n=1 Tax=Nesidiocoris tenuis TaxID=355587 RepID=A0A6H5H378_9HEMI|nr:unnamed protein product [Nesidiocoris tenuis]
MSVNLLVPIHVTPEVDIEVGSIHHLVPGFYLEESGNGTNSFTLLGQQGDSGEFSHQMKLLEEEERLTQELGIMQVQEKAIQDEYTAQENIKERLEQEEERYWKDYSKFRNEFILIEDERRRLCLNRESCHSTDQVVFDFFGTRNLMLQWWPSSSAFNNSRRKWKKAIRASVSHTELTKANWKTRPQDIRFQSSIPSSSQFKLKQQLKHRLLVVFFTLCFESDVRSSGTRPTEQQKTFELVIVNGDMDPTSSGRHARLAVTLYVLLVSAGIAIAVKPRQYVTDDAVVLEDPARSKPADLLGSSTKRSLRRWCAIAVAPGAVPESNLLLARFFLPTFGEMDLPVARVLPKTFSKQSCCGRSQISMLIYNDVPLCAPIRHKSSCDPASLRWSRMRLGKEFGASRSSQRDRMMRSSDSGYDEDEGTRTWVGKVMRPGSAKSWNWSGPGRQVWLRSLLTAFVSVSRMLRGVTAPLLGIQTNRFPARTSFSSNDNVGGLTTSLIQGLLLEQMFGVCCEKPASEPPVETTTTTTAKPELPPVPPYPPEGIRPANPVPPNWPPPLPTHPPDHTIPPLPTHPPSPGYPGIVQPQPPTTSRPTVRPPATRPPATQPPRPPVRPPTRPPTQWPGYPPPTAKPPVTPAPPRPPQPQPPSVDPPPTAAQCGAKNGYQDQERIVGGQNADLGEWPWINGTIAVSTFCSNTRLLKTPYLEYCGKDDCFNVIKLGKENGICFTVCVVLGIFLINVNDQVATGKQPDDLKQKNDLNANIPIQE